MSTEPSDDQAILQWRVRVPEHVVYRDFPDETVILNLESGMYHGLNRVAARMLAALEASESVSDVIDDLAAEFGQPREVIQRDLLELCRALSERGLIQDAGERAA